MSDSTGPLTVELGTHWQMLEARFSLGPLLTLIACSALAAPECIHAQSADPSTRGAIRGTIFDRNTSQPVVGVRLRMTATDPDRTARQAVTDSLGQYRFENIRWGDYTMTLARLGYHPLELEVVINRAAPMTVSVGLVPAPVSLPDVTIETNEPSRPVGTRGIPSIISRRNTIDSAEISERGLTNQDAYSVIRRLRPGWLNQRAQSTIAASANRILLYIDNVRRGTIDELRSIDAGMVAWIHFFDPIQATQEWGTGHVNGAINVLLKPPPR